MSSEFYDANGFVAEMMAGVRENGVGNDELYISWIMHGGAEHVIEIYDEELIYEGEVSGGEFPKFSPAEQAYIINEINRLLYEGQAEIERERAEIERENAEERASEHRTASS